MNLLLLRPGEIDGDGLARLRGRRADHVREVLRAGAGETVTAGLLGGKRGRAEVVSVDEREIVLRPALDEDPPPRSPVDLLVALPRPKILRKVLQSAASIGVGRIVLLGSWRVEKSYWSSPVLTEDAMLEELALGLEQGRDTIPPRVELRRLFKPFVEDELEVAFAGADRLLAHPAAASSLAGLAPAAPRAVVAIGPEGGWTPYEAAKLEEHGFRLFSFGPRPLRVDAALPWAAGQVELWLQRGDRTRTAP